MTGFNAVNRGVYISDNLAFLQSLNDDCIDLVNIDPPFAKNDTFGKKNDNAKDPLKPPLSAQERDDELRLLRRWGINTHEQAIKSEIVWPETAYKDIWNWENDVHEGWVKLLDNDFPAISSVITATRHTHSEETAAYLCFMAIRLIEIHRILKPTGSIFLHCDHTANGYLRQLLDAVFGNGENGSPGFRNEIAWCYTGPSNTKRWFPRKHDTIYWYSKGAKWMFNWQDVRIPYVKLETGNTSGIFKGAATLDSKGKVPEDYWLEDRDKMSPVGRIVSERTGYPTQKPISLAERIIKATTQEGEVVLDCFAGCAYSSIAAERLNRRWVACDVNPRAWTVFKRQFVKSDLLTPPLECNDETTGQQVLKNITGKVVTVHGPNELPTRTSPVHEDQPQNFPLPERTFKVAASIIPEAEMLRELLKLSNYMAWCCGFANRRPDGKIIETTRNFHLDHIAPKSKANTGTSNDIQNRAPMCPYHNIRKNNRRVALAEYRLEIADAGELMVDTINELINLDFAFQEANKLFGMAWARKYPMEIPN